MKYGGCNDGLGCHVCQHPEEQEKERRLYQDQLRREDKVIEKAWLAEQPVVINTVLIGVK